MLPKCFPSWSWLLILWTSDQNNSDNKVLIKFWFYIAFNNPELKDTNNSIQILITILKMKIEGLIVE